jgi:hypothetical protein
MRIFLGLPLMRPSLTDEQYIERLRKWRQSAKYWGWFFAVMCVVQFGVLIAAIWLINSMLTTMREVPEDDQTRKGYISLALD